VNTIPPFTDLDSFITFDIPEYGQLLLPLNNKLERSKKGHS